MAGLAYDLAALKFRGEDAILNFDISNYNKEMLNYDQVVTATSPAS